MHRSMVPLATKVAFDDMFHFPLPHPFLLWQLYFFVQWEGFTKDWNSWEPIEQFLHRYNTKWRDYVKRHNLSAKRKNVDYLGKQPSDPAAIVSCRHLCGGVRSSPSMAVGHWWVSIIIILPCSLE